MNMEECEFENRLIKGIEKLLEGLEVTGLEKMSPVAGRGDNLAVDVLVKVRVGNRLRKLGIQCLQAGYPGKLKSGIDYAKRLNTAVKDIIPVLAMPFASENVRGILKEQKINYLDLSGNIFLSFDNVLIDRTTAENLYPEGKKGINIFSDRASLVVRAMIDNPGQFLTVRTIAEKTGTSVGWISEVLRELDERGCLERRRRSGCRLQGIEHLLNEWTTVYRFSAKNQVCHYFIKSETLDEMLARLKELKIPDDIKYALTLHGGARLVTPFTEFNECHIYVDSRYDFEEQAGFFIKSLRLVEPIKGGNFHLIKPYYKSSVFYCSGIHNGLRVVSDLQLYLDLARFPVRGSEQAQKVLEHSGIPDFESW